MKYFAHRGLSSVNKDNSELSISEAIKHGYYGVELDVQLSSDNELILCHDLYMNDKFVNDLSCDELESMGIISLKYVYENIHLSNTQILLDIKGTNVYIINMLIEFYNTRNHENVTFCSFNRNLAHLIPSFFNRGVIFESILHKSEYNVMTSGFDSVVIHWTCLCSEFNEFCRKNNIKIFTYTHKEKMEIEYMKKFEIDYIITNGI